MSLNPSLTRIVDLNGRLASVIGRRAKKHASAALWSKAVLVAAPAAVISILQFWQPIGENGTYATFQIIGFCASAVAILGVVFSFYLERDVDQDIDGVAEAAALAQSHLKDMDGIATTIRSLVGSRDTLSLLRKAGTIIEHGIEAKQPAEYMIQEILKTGKKDLVNALEVSVTDNWSVQIYRVEEPPGQGNQNMVCLAEARLEERDLKSARAWPSGMGITGGVLATRMEKVVPNMKSPSGGSGFEVPPEFRRPSDETHLRSIACVPICLGKEKAFWGAITGVSSRLDHFANDGPGLERVEVLRSLAVVLAIAIMATKNDQ